MTDRDIKPANVLIGLRPTAIQCPDCLAPPGRACRKHRLCKRCGAVGDEGCRTKAGKGTVNHSQRFKPAKETHVERFKALKRAIAAEPDRCQTHGWRTVPELGCVECQTPKRTNS